MKSFYQNSGAASLLGDSPFKKRRRSLLFCSEK